MIASVHVATLGPRAALLRPPKPARHDGLRDAQAGMAATLGRSVVPALQPTRGVLLAFWDDEPALDRFLDSGALPGGFDGGWTARLRPVRAYGAWPGLDETVPRSRAVSTDGPVVVTTLARLKPREAVRFFRTTAKAEERVVQADGLRWATGFGRPPFLATLSIWNSAEAAADYAYGDTSAAHPDAISASKTRSFHSRQAFIRWEVLAASGSVESRRNPLPDGSVSGT